MIGHDAFEDEDDPNKLTVAAVENGHLIGLANLLHPPGTTTAELRFVFVEPEHRGRGVVSGLIAALDRFLAARGATKITATYDAEEKAVHHALEAAGWAWPLAGTLVCRGSWPKISGSPLMKVPLPSDQETVPFFDVEKKAMKKLRRERWYPELLGPFPKEPVDPIASLVILRSRVIVGWSVVHRPKPDRLVYGRLFVHPDHRILQRGVALVAEGIRRQVAAGIMTAGFGVGADNRPMVAFTRRKLAPWLDQLKEMLTAEKAL